MTREKAEAIVKNNWWKNLGFTHLEQYNLSHEDCEVHLRESELDPKEYCSEYLIEVAITKKGLSDDVLSNLEYTDIENGIIDGWSCWEVSSNNTCWELEA